MRNLDSDAKKKTYSHIRTQLKDDRNLLQYIATAVKEHVVFVPGVQGLFDIDLPTELAIANGLIHPYGHYVNSQYSQTNILSLHGLYTDTHSHLF